MMCPNWCDRDHTGDYEDEHRTVIDTIIGEGELALTVAVLAPIDDEEARIVEMTWCGRDPDDDDRWFLEAINLDPAEVPRLVEALQHAHALVRDPSIAGGPLAAT